MHRETKQRSLGCRFFVGFASDLLFLCMNWIQFWTWEGCDKRIEMFSPPPHFLTVVIDIMGIILACLAAVFCLGLFGAFLSKKRTGLDKNRSKPWGMCQLPRLLSGLVMQRTM